MTNDLSTRPRLLMGGALVSLLAGLVFATARPDVAAGSEPEAPRAENHYIGAAKCKSCHKADETGNQYGVWESRGHAKAFETLGTDAAKKIAAEKGIEDPQKAPECLRCHVTAYGLPEDQIKRGFKPEAGVGCESCHGPGEEHMKARMTAAAKGETDAKPEPGEMNANPTEADCRGCHNPDSPTFKPFCFPMRSAAIRHLNPSKERTAEELDAFLVCGCGDDCKCSHECADGCAIPPSQKK